MRLCSSSQQAEAQPVETQSPGLSLSQKLEDHSLAAPGSNLTEHYQVMANYTRLSGKGHRTNALSVIKTTWRMGCFRFSSEERKKTWINGDKPRFGLESSFIDCFIRPVFFSWAVHLHFTRSNISAPALSLQIVHKLPSDSMEFLKFYEIVLESDSIGALQAMLARGRCTINSIKVYESLGKEASLFNVKSTNNLSEQALNDIPALH